MRDILEELEPGVHTYIPLNIVSSKSIGDKMEHGTFYLIHSVPWVRDALVIDETEFNKGFGRKGYEQGKDGIGGGGISSNPNDVCVVFGPAIDGHHLWLLRDAHNRYKYMCSEELWKRIQADGIRGWGIRKKCKVKWD